jgi:hypothetical protein
MFQKFSNYAKFLDRPSVICFDQNCLEKLFLIPRRNLLSLFSVSVEININDRRSVCQEKFYKIAFFYAMRFFILRLRKQKRKYAGLKSAALIGSGREFAFSLLHF